MEIDTIKEVILSLIKEEREYLSKLRDLSMAQYKAIKEKDAERIISIVKEREGVGEKIVSLSKEREGRERDLAVSLGFDPSSFKKDKLFNHSRMKELKEEWEGILDLASQIRKIDEENEEEMMKRMGEIEEKLGDIKRARKLREVYFRKKRESLYINKSIE